MSDANKKTVLIVEDMEDIATFVLLALEHMGLEAHAVNSALKAAEFLETHWPDLIILDIGLPGMTGWQLLDIIKERRETHRMFVIITTAYSDPANRVIGKLQHVDHYLNKPFEIRELRAIINRLLELDV